MMREREGERGGGGKREKKEASCDVGKERNNNNNKVIWEKKLPSAAEADGFSEKNSSDTNPMMRLPASFAFEKSLPNWKEATRQNKTASEVHRSDGPRSQTDKAPTPPPPPCSGSKEMRERPAVPAP